MNRYSETRNTWNKVAQAYQEKFLSLELYNETYDTFCRLIDKDNPSILDLGCGPGNITKYLLSKRSDFNILGIDYASNMIELAKINIPEARFEVMDIRKIDRLRNEFDGIICGFCLPYLSYSEVEDLIKNCSRILSDAGIIYLSFVEGDPNQSGYQTGKTGDRMYIYYHPQDRIQNILEDYHFSIISSLKKLYEKSEEKELLHTIMIAGKK